MSARRRSPKDRPFICPECSSRKHGGRLYIDPAWTFGGKATGSPWDAVLQTVRCGNCEAVIPAHLGHRWKELPFKTAQEEWRLKFRPNEEPMSSKQWRGR